MRKLLLASLAAFTFALTGCGYNTFQATDEQIKGKRPAKSSTQLSAAP